MEANKLSEEQRQQLVNDLRGGMKPGAVAKKHDVHYATIAYYREKAGLRKNRYTPRPKKIALPSSGHTTVRLAPKKDNKLIMLMGSPAAIREYLRGDDSWS